MDSHPRQPNRGFTLVELLVVIGIIALLIGLILPALSKAQKAAKQTACQANLHSISQAVQLLANDHDGYISPSGNSCPAPSATPVIGSGAGDGSPGAMDDYQVRRYMYFNDGGVSRAMPLPAALGSYLGTSLRSDSRADLEADLTADSNLKSVFTCPGEQDGPIQTHMNNYPVGVMGPLIWSSYAMNSGVGAYKPYTAYAGSKWGKLTNVKNPTITALLFDGMDELEFSTAPTVPPDPASRWAPIIMFTNVANATMGDALNFINAGSPSVLRDTIRHDGRMNVLFCDGHVASYYINPQDLASVWMENEK